MCSWAGVCVCVCNKACHAVCCFPTLFISLIIIFLNLISLISRGAVSVRTAVKVCACLCARVCVDGACALVLYAACRVRQNCFCVVFFQVFYDFFFFVFLLSLFFAVEKENESTDNIEKKSVQSVDMKQANLTGRCDRVYSEPPRKGRPASLVPCE